VVGAALGHAEKHGLSVHDSCYAVLAAAQGDVFVTADRRLAAASTAAEPLI
jgi:predicted nucleic acid-binding protein